MRTIAILLGAMLALAFLASLAPAASAVGHCIQNGDDPKYYECYGTGEGSCVGLEHWYLHVEEGRGPWTQCFAGAKTGSGRAVVCTDLFANGDCAGLRSNESNPCIGTEGPTLGTACYL